MQVHLRKYDGVGGGWVAHDFAGRSKNGVWKIPLLGRLKKRYQQIKEALAAEDGAVSKPVSSSAKTKLPKQVDAPPNNRPIYLPSLPLSSHFNDPRNDLEKLRAQLQESGTSAVLAGAKAALHGMGGVGKTQLALQYCHRFNADYAGVWWLQAETMAGLAQDCVLFCSKQGLQLAPGEAPFPVMNAWLAQQSNWLLVYDNAEDAQALQAVLPNTTSAAGGHHILITSRQPVWQGMQTIALDVWQDCRSAALFAAAFASQ